jgi:hypothetical protein
MRRRLALLVVTLALAGPALAGCGGSGHHASAAGAGTTSTGSTTSTSTTATSTSTSTSTSTATTATAGQGAAREHLFYGPSGGPVPAGTRATSITFISPSIAFVLGTAPCAHPPCSAILRTRDRGATWVGLPAPLESVSGVGGDGLWGLRFADSHHGYAFGHGLWQTTDGGAHWQRARAPGQAIVKLEAVADRELVAIVSPGSTLALYHRSLAGGSWTRVAGGGTAIGAASLSVNGSNVWAIVGAKVLRSTDGGLSFGLVAAPCRSGFSPLSIADDGPHVYVLCVGQGAAGSTEKQVFQADATGGSAWTPAGRPPRAGDGGELAAGSDRALVISSASGASFLYHSTDAGRHWRTGLLAPDGGAGWSDLGFTTATDAVVIHGAAGSNGAGATLGQVLLSEDGGLTWHRASL